MTTWPTGGLWENTDLTIEMDYEQSRLVGGSTFARFGEDFGPPCPHAQNVTRSPAVDGDMPCERETWTVPRVLINWNEAGQSTTGCCADCVVDFVLSLRTGEGNAG